MRFALTVRGFIREHLTLDEARRIVRERMAQRGQRLVSMIDQSILNNPRSAYKRLFDEAGVDKPRLEKLVKDHGVEGALHELRDRGVFVTYEEYKGVTTETDPHEEKFGKDVTFDNPVLGAGFSTRSSGSRSRGSRYFLDFDGLKEHTVHRLLQSEEFGMADSDRAAYLPILPGATGLKLILLGHYMGQPQTAWFSPVDPRNFRLLYRLQTAYVLGALRFAGAKVPWPRHVPLSDVRPIARWVAEHNHADRPSFVQGYATSAVRICEAAAAEGLDISGARFCMMGEPVTQSKHDAVRAVGAVPFTAYGAVESGQLANSCTHSQSPDDMHFFTDSFSLIRHKRSIPPDGTEIEPFLITSLLSRSSLVLLNVELDDYGDVEERPCDCVWGQLGLTLHISNIRSFVKLTAEGMSFVGTNLVHVIEEELPSRFGGGPSDYQLLELEDGQGHTRLTLRVSPKVGEVDEKEIVALLYERITAGGWTGKYFRDIWTQADSIGVARKAPEPTASGKVFPFHTLR